jgi:uncharacterized protein YbcI
MKSSGEMEAEISEAMRGFERLHMGYGPRNVRVHVLDDLLVIRLQEVLTKAEQHLVNKLSPEKGRDLLKQVRRHLVETSRPVIEEMIANITGVRVLSLHHDISTVTGEEVVLFTLSGVPQFRKSQNK